MNRDKNKWKVFVNIDEDNEADNDEDEGLDCEICVVTDKWIREHDGSWGWDGYGDGKIKLNGDDSCTKDEIVKLKLIAKELARIMNEKGW
jgi:hypothetical protein